MREPGIDDYLVRKPLCYCLKRVALAKVDPAAAEYRRAVAQANRTVPHLSQLDAELVARSSEALRQRHQAHQPHPLDRPRELSIPFRSFRSPFLWGVE